MAAGDRGHVDALLGIEVPPAFGRRVLVIAAEGARLYVAAEWRDALVVVHGGEVELERSTGARDTFLRGDILTLDGLPLRCLRNPGVEPAVLVALSLRCPSRDR